MILDDIRFRHKSSIKSCCICKDVCCCALLYLKEEEEEEYLYNLSNQLLDGLEQIIKRRRSKTNKRSLSFFLSSFIPFLLLFSFFIFILLLFIQFCLQVNDLIVPRNVNLISARKTKKTKNFLFVSKIAPNNNSIDLSTFACICLSVFIRYILPCFFICLSIFLFDLSYLVCVTELSQRTFCFIIHPAFRIRCNEEKSNITPNNEWECNKIRKKKNF